MNEIKEKVEEALKATNANDIYSVGMRNAFRYVIYLIDGKEPQYEDCYAEIVEAVTTQAAVMNAVSLTLDETDS